MRLIWYIALGIALWYLGKAVMRHYLKAQEVERKQEISSSSHTRSEDPSTRGTSYEDIHDAKYRDVE